MCRLPQIHGVRRTGDKVMVIGWRVRQARREYSERHGRRRRTIVLVTLIGVIGVVWDGRISG
jgi:hypothetical protein